MRHSEATKVNTAYATMVTNATNANGQEYLTSRMPITSANSNRVGPMLNRTMPSRKVIAYDAALDHARELARAPLQVIAQREAEQVAEHPQRHEAPGGLGDLGEDRIAQLAEPGGAQAGEAVGEQRRERQRERRALGLAQPVDHGLEEERHLDGDDLGGDQEDEAR